MAASGTPKYVALQEDIRKQIENGSYAVGERIPSETALAKEAGVALMTVRHAIGDLVASGMLERRHGSGTYVSERTLGRNLGLVFFHVGNIKAQSLPRLELDTIRHAAAEAGRQVRAVLLVPPYQEPEQLVKELRAMEVGAVGLVSFGRADRRYIETLSREIPCVLFNKELPGVALPCAKPDLGEGTRKVVEYFVARGRRRIGMMFSETEHIEQRDLMAMFEAEMRRHDLPIDKGDWLECIGRSRRNQAEEWINQMLDRPDRPDALVIVDHHREWPHLLRACMGERQEKIGRDLDVLAVVEGLPLDEEQHDVPWARLSLEHGRIIRNAQRLLLETAERGREGRSMPVLLSETSLIPPGE